MSKYCRSLHNLFGYNCNWNHFLPLHYLPDSMSIALRCVSNISSITLRQLFSDSERNMFKPKRLIADNSKAILLLLFFLFLESGVSFKTVFIFSVYK